MSNPDSLALERIEQRPQTLRLIALERLRDAILEGRIVPGERLVERTLSDRLGVSRSVIREVIRNLESEGLVETTGSGPRLATINRDETSQVYAIRLQLESAAAAACARKATPEVLRALTAELDAIAQAHAEHKPINALRATNSFYETMFLGGGHTVAWEIVQRLHGRISRLRAMTLSSEQRKADGLSQMREIVSAIKAGDAARAEAACRQHVEGAARQADILLTSRDSEVESV
ncbi:transcriptional regulator, GntR family [Novosphingobium nitrogenifigens DSM 19370]|uniref:Transcriptional regulator, GntR family n=1 Tax=Novosphingobium nitrogenifigens DSM 19370 TaxID=983920 RepID=F1Z343_9SPHN|nr:GntR family transcriptional regulator [Novosphingobium nitrogenifigens]EGD60970.1 transcriptional regulator, GntR family [Novosphingobium nitrogenifigens DSM 19370]